MKYEDLELYGARSEGPEDLVETLGLDDFELERIAFLAEHPEMEDPLLAHLRPKPGKGD